MNGQMDGGMDRAQLLPAPPPPTPWGPCPRLTDFVCNVDADLLCSQCGLTEGDPGLPTTRASPVQKDLQTTSGGQGLSFIFIGLAGPGGGPPVPQWHALDSWLG